MLSLGWIIVVALIPASQRPYIGSTLSNSPWEMVFGYNGLGRFGSSTADGDAYRSFTPLALLIGAAFAAARRSGALWAQLALPIAAALSALGISIGLALGAGGTACIRCPPPSCSASWPPWRRRSSCGSDAAGDGCR